MKTIAAPSWLKTPPTGDGRLIRRSIRIVIAVCLLHQAATSADVIEFAGKMEQVTYSYRDPESRAIQNSFVYVARVSNRSWQLEIKDLANQRPSLEYLFNGEKLFTSSDFTGLKSHRTKTAPTANKRHIPTNAMTVKKTWRVHSATVPPSGVGQAFPIWLAFCSGPYFDSAPDAEMPDFTWMTQFPPSAEGPRLKFQARKRESSSYWMPEEVSFHSGGTYRTRDSEGNVSQRPWPAPFADGFRVATFRSEKWRKLGDLEYPTSAVLEVVQPIFDRTRNAGATPSLEPKMRTTITTETASYRGGEMLPAEPQIENGDFIFVTDHSFKTSLGTPLQYFSTSGVLTATSRGFSNIYDANEFRAKRRAMAKTRWQWWPLFAWTVFGLITAVPIAAIYYRRTHMRHTNPYTESTKNH